MCICNNCTIVLRRPDSKLAIAQWKRKVNKGNSSIQNNVFNKWRLANWDIKILWPLICVYL